MTNISRLRNKRRGLSLVEVLIAVFVVSVGTLGAVSALWYGIKTEKYAERRSSAVFLGREMLNLIRSRNLPFLPTVPPVGDPINDGDYDDPGDDNGARRPYNAPPFSNDFDTDFNFERRIEMKLMSSNPNNHLSQMAGIKVTLYWVEGGAQKEVTLWGFHRRP